MKGHTAVITGGLGDIGTAICHEFIKQGARVIALDRVSLASAKTWQAKQSALGYSIDYIQVDVTDYVSCQQMYAQLIKLVNSVQILVNAAGAIDDVSFRKMTPEQWQHIVHTDLDSMFCVSKQFVEGMIQQKYGRIINISSVSAQMGQFGQVNYSAAKAGVYGFTKSLALELARYGITVNAVSPGFVEGKMVASIPDTVQKKIIEAIPVQRLSQPDEIAWAIAFLASERSGFITGSNLAINGGIYMS